MYDDTAPGTITPRPARGGRVPARARPSRSPRTTTGAEPAGFLAGALGNPPTKGAFLSPGPGTGAPSRRQWIADHAMAWTTIHYPCYAPRAGRFALVACRVTPTLQIL